MLNTVSKHEKGYPIVHGFGYVERLEQERFLIKTKDSRYSARKAVSCFQLPGLGDKVLFVADPEGDCYILAVLETETGKNKVVFDGDTDFVCKDGNLNIVSEQDVGILTAGELSFVSSDLQVHADNGRVTIRKAMLLGSHLLSRFASIKLISGSVESVADRFRQRVKRSYREVEETGHVKAKKVDYAAEELLTIRGKYAMFSAEEDVKINGERIHMG